MQKLLPILLALVFFLAAIGNFPDGAIASLVCVLTVLAWVWIIKYNCEDKKQLSFLISLFLGAVLVRVLYSTIAYYFDFWLYVAGDAETYNGFGNILANYLHGEGVLDEFTKNRFFNLYGSGWGMFWFVGLFYYVVGQNPMAGNFFTLVFGAAAAPFTYFCAKELFNNSKVAKYSALLVAFFPGFINWSSFMMKDGLIILLLVVGIYSILQLQKKFSAGHVVSLLIVLFGMLALRFYIFPMFATAIFGAMLIGINTERSAQSLVGRFISIIIIGTLLSYGGALRVTQMNIERFGNIEFLKNARKDQSQTADSGFSDTDLSTTEAQITFLPIGLANLMFAPYPWQITSLRSAATLPEMFVWWLSMPFLFIGFWFAITKRFRQTLPVLIFTIMLTIGYSLFQGNAGTAYRQRTQIQVFLFMFIAVGWELKREKKENERIIDSIKKKKLEETIQQMRKDT